MLAGLTRSLQESIDLTSRNSPPRPSRARTPSPPTSARATPATPTRPSGASCSPSRQGHQGAESHGLAVKAATILKMSSTVTPTPSSSSPEIQLWHWGCTSILPARLVHGEALGDGHELDAAAVEIGNRLEGVGHRPERWSNLATTATGMLFRARARKRAPAGLVAVPWRRTRRGPRGSRRGAGLSCAVGEDALALGTGGGPA